MVGDWTLSIFAALLCVGAGLFAALAASEFSDFSERTLKICAALGFVCLSLGGFAAISNLGRPSMILGVFGNPKSWLFWEMVGVTGALVAGLIYLICLYREADQTRTRAFSLISALFSLIAVFALGANMVMSWRPVLNSYTLMLPFIGLYWSAASLCFLVEGEFEDAEIAKAKISSAAAACVTGLGYAAYTGYLLSDPETSEGAREILSGSLSLNFWIGCGLCGVVLPLAGAFTRKAKKVLATVGLAGIFIAVFVWQNLLLDIGQAAWHFFKP